MNLYEINAELERFDFEIDEETGEVLNADTLDNLQMEFNEKVDNIACYIKDLDALAAARNQEAKNLMELAEQTEKKRDRLKAYLQSILNGNKFESERCKISYRSSTQTVVDKDTFTKWAEENAPDLLEVVTTVKYNLIDIKKAIESGVAVEGARLTKNVNMSIK